MKINDNVEIGKAKVLGVVKEVSTDSKSILVSHSIMVDGVSKSIDQWYSVDIVAEVDLHAEAQDVFKEMEAKGLTSKEISDLVSAGGTKFKDTAILMGVLPKEES